MPFPYSKAPVFSPARSFLPAGCSLFFRLHSYAATCSFFRSDIFLSSNRLRSIPALFLPHRKIPYPALPCIWKLFAIPVFRAEYACLPVIINGRFRRSARYGYFGPFPVRAQLHPEPVLCASFQRCVRILLQNVRYVYKTLFFSDRTALVLGRWKAFRPNLDIAPQVPRYVPIGTKLLLFHPRSPCAIVNTTLLNPALRICAVNTPQPKIE